MSALLIALLLATDPQAKADEPYAVEYRIVQGADGKLYKTPIVVDRRVCNYTAPDGTNVEAECGCTAETCHFTWTISKGPQPFAQRGKPFKKYKGLSMEDIKK